MNLTKTHPNATTAGVSSASALVIVWIAQMVGLDVGPELAVVFAGAWTTVALAVGRNGLRGLIRKVWRGGNANGG